MILNESLFESIGTIEYKPVSNIDKFKKYADGLSGLDNFSYGSVVYDLKPGTYRKIRDGK